MGWWENVTDNIGDWYNDVTPWDTYWEQQQNARQRQNAVDDYQDRLEDAYNNIGSPPEAVDDDGDGRPDRLIDPDTGETLQDYGYINDLLDEASEAGQSLPTYEDWLESTGRTHTDIEDSEPYQNMQDLIDQMNAGPTDAEWDDAYNHAARLMGITEEEYQEIVGNLTSQLAEGPEGEQGMSEEELALRERDIRNQIRNAEERAQRMIENIRANSGSSTRAYMAADQALRQINDYELRQEVALAEEEMRRRKASFDAKEQHWALMVERNQMGVEQYIGALERSKAQAFQGYAMQMNAVFQQNAQYLQMHQQEMARVQQHVQNIYTAINAEIGVSQHIGQQIMDQYGMQLAQYQAELNAIAMDFQLETTAWAMEDQAQAGMMGTIFGGLQIAAGVASMFIPGASGVGFPLLSSGLQTWAGAQGVDVTMPQFSMPAAPATGGGGGGAGGGGASGGGYPSAGSGGGVA